MTLQPKEYAQLIEGIGQLLKAGREKAVQEVNSALVQPY